MAVVHGNRGSQRRRIPLVTIFVLMAGVVMLLPAVVRQFSAAGPAPVSNDAQTSASMEDLTRLVNMLRAKVDTLEDRGPSSARLVNGLNQQGVGSVTEPPITSSHGQVSRELHDRLHGVLQETEQLQDTQALHQAHHSEQASTNSVSDPRGPPEWVEAPTPVKPLWGLKHKRNGDAVFGLAFGYGKTDYMRFVGSLRETGYDDDIVLATSAPKDMKPGVEEYLKTHRVLSYPFGFQCKKKGGGRKLLVTPAGCTLTDWYENGDPRGPRPLALIRYEHYKTWLELYSDQSWFLILDFRDTVFQRNPFSQVVLDRSAPIDLHLFEENRQVKRVGICPFNSGWLGCWGRDVPRRFSNRSVVCSGSTLGSRYGVTRYVDRMIQEMDSQQCHVKRGTESDQGYHNYLFHTGKLAEAGIRVVAHEQGRGIVNTVGAMNGFRVPADKKGPLGTFWKARDADGYIINWDGQKSPVVHQWDRFAKELLRWIDKNLAK